MVANPTEMYLGAAPQLLSLNEIWNLPNHPRIIVEWPGCAAVSTDPTFWTSTAWPAGESGGLITLALVAQAELWSDIRLNRRSLPTVVLFTGIATISRLNALNRDDYRWVIGMNRLRHAYLELHPELEPHFIASQYDDLEGALQTLGLDRVTAESKVGDNPFTCFKHCRAC